MARAKLNEELKNKIKSSTTGTGELATPEEVYYGNLPEGQTKETVATLANYNTEYVAASHQAAGELAVEQLVKDKKLTEVTSHVSLGAFGHADFTFQREKVTPVPGKKDETVTIKGASKVNVTFIAGENGGALKASKRSIREMADEKL